MISRLASRLRSVVTPSAKPETRAECLIRTNGVYLFAPMDENTIRSLKDLKSETVKSDLARWGLSHCVKLGTHTHVKFFAQLVRVLGPHYPGWEMIDIGGYVGAIGLPVAKWISENPDQAGAKVTIFEPTEMAEFIERSIELNKLGAVAKLRREAASDRAGSATFAQRHNEHVAGGIVRFLKWRPNSKSTVVETATVDQAMVGTRDKLLLIKIDTEGHEPNVLNGMGQILSDNTCVLAIEFHKRCIGRPVFGRTFGQYLFENFHLYNVGNIGYPSKLEPIRSGDLAALHAYAARSGNKLTDILCFSRAIPDDKIAEALAGYLH